MANLTRDAVAQIIRNAPPGVAPEDVVHELVRSGHTLEGYSEFPAAPTPPAEPAVPGMQPPTDEQAAWNQAKASGNDYFAAKKQVLAARNKYTQSQPPGSMLDTVRGAADVSSKMAFAAPQIAKAGVQAVGEGVRQAAPDSMIASGAGKAIDFASNAIPTSPGELAVQATGEKYAEPALRAAAPVAKKALGFMAEKFGGLAGDTVALLEKNAPAVVKYARMGVDAAAEAAASAAKAVKGHIENYADSAGEAYRAAIDKIVATNPQYNNIRIDLQRTAGKTVDAIRSDFGFPDASARLPNLQLVAADGRPIQAAQGAIERVGKSETDTKLFNDFAAQFKNSVTPTQAYLLQKDLSYAIRANADNPIAVALGRLKKLAVSAFDGAVEGTPLSSINKNYRAAQELAEDLSKVSNADNAVSIINSAFRNKGETRDALNAISAVAPEVKTSLDDMFAATAGKQVAHWTAQIPPTGMKALYTVGLGIGGHAVVANPVTGIPAVAGYLAATSPRVYGEAFNALSGSAPKVAAGVPTATIAALRAMRGRQ